jgi:hypothetical protein
VAAAADAVKAAREAFEAKSSSEHAHSLAAAMLSLQALLKDEDKDSQAQALSGTCLLFRWATGHSAPAAGQTHACACAVAAQKGAVPELQRCCGALSEQPSELCTALSTLHLVLGSEAAQEDFCRGNAAELLAGVLRAHAGAAGPPSCMGVEPYLRHLLSHSIHADDASIVEGAAACAEVAAAKHEGNKCACMDAGVASMLVGAARLPGMGPAALERICAALRTFATADDARPSTSRCAAFSVWNPHAFDHGSAQIAKKPAHACRAFQNGRAIAKAGATEALLGVLTGEEASHAPAVAAAVCNAMRRIAVNDDICNEWAELGGVEVTMQALRSAVGGPPALPRAACALLRQLANADALKAAILSAGGLALLQDVVSGHLASAGAKFSSSFCGRFCMKKPRWSPHWLFCYNI